MAEQDPDRVPRRDRARADADAEDDGQRDQGRAAHEQGGRGDQRPACPCPRRAPDPTRSAKLGERGRDQRTSGWRPRIRSRSAFPVRGPRPSRRRSSKAMTRRLRPAGVCATPGKPQQPVDAADRLEPGAEDEEHVGLRRDEGLRRELLETLDPDRLADVDAARRLDHRVRARARSRRSAGPAIRGRTGTRPSARRARASTSRFATAICASTWRAELSRRASARRGRGRPRAASARPRRGPCTRG